MNKEIDQIMTGILHQLSDKCLVKLRESFMTGKMQMCKEGDGCTARAFMCDLTDEELQGASKVLARMMSSEATQKEQIIQILGHCVQEEILRSDVDDFPEVIGEEVNDDDRN